MPLASADQRVGVLELVQEDGGDVLGCVLDELLVEDTSAQRPANG
jgi:hypothetical protein